MYLVLVIDHIYELPIFKDVVLELDKLLALAHVAALCHSPDLESVRVYGEALIRQVGIKEPSKDHDLVLIDGEAAKLAALCITARPLQEDQLPMGRTMEVV